MFSKTKIALAAAIVLGTAVMASAASNPPVSRANGGPVYNLIPGYDKDGRTVGIPDPNKFATQARHS
ncbi:MAG: hypothetical protein ABSE22_18350 [Xanthobacteraceae bacterium]